MTRLPLFAVRPASAGRVILLGLLATLIFSHYTLALQFVSGSKCESVCSDQYAGTVHEDVRCLDHEFDSAPAIHLKECVACQLNSTAVDPVTKVTDVQWGLFHLRFILANCMFGYPEERVSISSPCQVSCAPLKGAVTFGISNSTNTTDYSADLGFCTGRQFDDFTINNCAFCYSFIPQQLILGNFLQALHIACHSTPPVGKPFYPDGVAIFNSSTIAGPSTQTPTNSNGNALTGSKLVLAIVLPLVGGIAILIGVCCCCWHFTRRRRAQMAASGRMSKFRDGQQISDFSPMSPITPNASPPQPFTWSEPARGTSSGLVMPKMAEHRVVEKQASHFADVPPAKPSPAWPHHVREGSTERLRVENSTYPGGDGSTPVLSEFKDPNLHEQFLGAQNQHNPPVGAYQV